MVLDEIKEYLLKIDFKNLKMDELADYIKCITLINREEAHEKISTEIVLKKQKITQDSKR